MKQITILLFKDRGSPVGRYQIPIVLIERWKKIAVGLGIVFVLGVVDYARARINTWELNKLREEAALQRESAEKLQASMDSLNHELERLHELERKMRIIANVPEAAVGQTAIRGVGGEEQDGEASDAAASAPAQAQPKTTRKTQDAAKQGEADAAQAVGGAQRHGNVSDAEVPVAAIPGAAGIQGDAPAAASALDPAVAPARFLALQHEASRLQVLAQSRSAAFEDLLEHLHAQSDRLASTPSIWPTRGWLTSGFGHRISPHTGQQQFHGAIDIAGSIGTDIIAPARGRVVFSGVKSQLGNCLIIEHGYGIQTTYAHNSKLFVKVGETVERGDLIAKMGSTGRSTGPHLHYAIEVQSKIVNPLDYILD